MGGPRKPSHLHEINDTYKKHPERRRTGEPTPRTGVGEAPESFSCDFETVWNEIVDCVCPGVLGCSDRIHLEITVRLLYEYRRDPENILGVKMKLLQNCLGLMGMNPSDRTRLTMLPQDQVTPKDKYF